MKMLVKFLDKEKDKLFTFLLLFFIAGLIFYPPIKQTFEYNVDEGIDSVKASLFLKGFPLYKQIWSDQPPLFTVILAGWFKLFGETFYQGRILVLLFSGLLLWMFYQTVRLRQDSLCAWLTCGFLILSAGFLRLAASIMIGTPSWALAVSAIYFLTLFKKNLSSHYLLLSGLFMALSLLTKFSPAFLLPVLLLEITAPEKQSLPKKSNLYQRLLLSMIWLIAAATVYLAITLIFFYPDLSLFSQQLFKTHAIRPDLTFNDFRVIKYLLIQDFDIVLWALTGIIWAIRSKEDSLILPSFWLCLGITVLAFYRPVWDHYYLFISLPLCWLAAFGLYSWVNEFTRELKLRPRVLLKPANILLIGLFLITLAVLPNKLIRAKNSLWGETDVNQRKMISLLADPKNDADWIATDMPTYAFYSGIPALPEIAVATIKRRFDNGLKEDYFIDTLKKYRPELILLGGFQDYPAPVMSYIKENYFLYYRTGFSTRTKGDLSPSFFATAYWEPIGKYLPSRIGMTYSKKLSELIWHKLRVPVLSAGIEKKEFYARNVSIELFLRKDKSP